MSKPNDPWQEGRSGESASGSGDDPGAQPTVGLPGTEDQLLAHEQDRSRYDASPGYGHSRHEPPDYGQPGYGQWEYGQPGYGPAGSAAGSYGEAPYTEAPYSRAPYGEAPHGQAGYGQAPYGQPGGPGRGYGGYGGYGAVPDHSGYVGYGPYGERPSGATVITAGVIQIVQAALFIFLGLILIFVADAFHRGLSDLQSEDGVDTDAGRAVTGAAIGVGIAIVLFAAFMIVLAALAMKRLRWAMITSVVVQSIALLLGIAGLAQNDSPGGNILFIASCAAVIVLFVIPPSARYFAYREV